MIGNKEVKNKLKLLKKELHCCLFCIHQELVDTTESTNLCCTVKSKNVKASGGASCKDFYLVWYKRKLLEVKNE